MSPLVSERSYIACCAMQGMLANPEYTTFNNETLIKEAFILADEFLKQDNVTNNTNS